MVSLYFVFFRAAKIQANWVEQKATEILKGMTQRRKGWNGNEKKKPAKKVFKEKQNEDYNQLVVITTNRQ